jgi:hypothetical protein
VIGLRAVDSLNNVELNRFTFLETLISISLNRTVMDEDILAAFMPEEAIALCVVEPFHCAVKLCHKDLHLQLNRIEAARQPPSVNGEALVSGAVSLRCRRVIGHIRGVIRVTAYGLFSGRGDIFSARCF